MIGGPSPDHTGGDQAGYYPWMIQQPMYVSLASQLYTDPCRRCLLQSASRSWQALPCTQSESGNTRALIKFLNTVSALLQLGNTMVSS